MEMIPLDRIRISSSNVRVEEYFGDEEDKSFVENVGTYGVMSPIYVRSVGDKYEVYSGRRRFLSAKESGLSEIPCIIKEVHDDEALDISLMENIQRKNLDPVTIGRALKRRIERSGIKPGTYAKKIGISKATMSEYLRMNDLSTDMQNEVQTGTVTFRDALKIVRMSLPPETEISLAKEAREGGSNSFKKTLAQITGEQETRGAPKGLLIVRINWGKRSSEYTALKKFAKSEGIELSEYCQKILTEHIKSRKG